MLDYGGLLKCKQAPNQTGSYTSIVYLTDTRLYTCASVRLPDNQNIPF